jgi:hypothetical protein
MYDHKWEWRWAKIVVNEKGIVVNDTKNFYGGFIDVFLVWKKNLK